jgi:D-amino peptidase
MADLKLYLMVDFEGAACVVGEPNKYLSELPQYPEIRRRVTAEANAAIEGCFEAGATEVLVNDAHSRGHNFLYDELHPDARVLLGTPRPRRFMGLDETFAGVMLIAYHPMAGTTNGVLSHSYSSKSIQHMWLNGREIGEMGFDGALAGALGVPVVLVTSCAEGCREAKEFFGEIETVTTKWGIGRNAAISLTPAKAREAIRAGAARAAGRAAECKPFRVVPPFELRTEYKNEAEVDGKRRGERVGPWTHVVRSEDLFSLL